MCPVITRTLPLLIDSTITLGPAFVKAFDDSLRMSKMVLVSIYKLFNGSISSDNISGPISIAKGASESAGLGFASFLTYLALISVNLGIFNLLPVPVLMRRGVKMVGIHDIIGIRHRIPGYIIHIL